MADDPHVFLFGDSIANPHVRFERGKRLVVSPAGSGTTVTFDGPDGRQEKGITLTPAEARRLAYLLLAALERER